MQIDEICSHLWKGFKSIENGSSRPAPSPPPSQRPLLSDFEQFYALGPLDNVALSPIMFLLHYPTPHYFWIWLLLRNVSTKRPESKNTEREPISCCFYDLSGRSVWDNNNSISDNSIVTYLTLLTRKTYLLLGYLLPKIKAPTFV